MKTKLVSCILLFTVAWLQAPAQDSQPNEIAPLARELHLEIEADNCEPSTTNSTYKRISLVVENEPLNVVLKNITAKCGTVFVFTDETFAKVRVSANFTNTGWKSIVAELLMKSGLEVWRGDLSSGVALIGTKESLTNVIGLNYIGASGVCLRTEPVAPFTDELSKRMNKLLTRFGSSDNEGGSLFVTDTCDRMEIIYRYTLRASKQGYSFSELMSAYEIELAK